MKKNKYKPTTELILDDALELTFDEYTLEHGCPKLSEEMEIACNEVAERIKKKYGI